MTTTKMSDLRMSPQDEIFLTFREFSGILFTFHATSFQPNHDTSTWDFTPNGFLWNLVLSQFHGIQISAVPWWLVGC
jgi:hypothetical protein